MDFLKRLLAMFTRPGMGQLRRRSGAPPLRIDVQPAPRAEVTDLRHYRRFDFGGRAHVHFTTTRAYADCVVLDASRTGARVVVPHDVALRPLQGIEIFFHGYTFRSRVSVAWQRPTDTGMEMGLTFQYTDMEVPVVDKFVSFLDWQAATRAA